MRLTSAETEFLTALVREQNQTGCRGPAHDLLRKHAYPNAPLSGPGSLAFAYEAIPLSSLLLQDAADFHEIDDFVHQKERTLDPKWPWPSPEEYKSRLEQARQAWRANRESHPVAAQASN